MTEDVVIVLNEKEKEKEKKARDLDNLLSSMRISSSRVETGEDLPAILVERGARIVVLDYILGDMTTSLDLIPHLKSISKGKDMQVIIWTDESSLAAAVEAMKLGVLDYKKLGEAGDVEKVAELVASSLKPLLKGPKRRITRHLKTRIVAESTEMKKVLQLCHSCVTRREELILIHGEAGTGRRCLARYIHSLRKHPGQFTEVDLDFWRDYRPTPSASSLFCNHIEKGDEAGLIETLRNIRKLPREQNPEWIILASAAESICAKWSRTLGAAIIPLPSLAKRLDDFLPLFRSFEKRCRRVWDSPRFSPSLELLKAIADMNWPGNVKQYEAAVFEALSGDGGTAGGELKERDSNLSHAEFAFLQRLVDSKERWEKYGI